MMRINVAGTLVVGLSLGACAPAAHPVATSQAPLANATAPSPSLTSLADAAAAPAPALLRAQEPFTGPQGTQPVWLDTRKRLHVGDWSIAVDHVDPQTHDYFWRQQASLEVVALGAQEMAVLLATPTSDDEDPPNRFQVFLLRNHALVRVFDGVVGVYGMQGLSIPGDGSLRYVEDGWTACERMGHPTRSQRQEVILRLDASLTMIESERVDSGGVQRCEELSACPMVYQVDHAGSHYLGEVLRNIRGKEAYAEQGLPLGALSVKVLDLRLAEEKPEVSFIDELYLSVAGESIYARACAGERPPSLCAADHVPTLLREGQTLDLRFEIPAALVGEPVEIVARGYYIPTPTAHLR